MQNEYVPSSETAFNSPLPFLRKLKHLIFGENIPDNYTKITFYINLFIWLIFFLWSIASFVAISFRDMIFSEKKISVELIIQNRGEVLGFKPYDFLERLITFHSISILLWLIFFVGLVLIWRKNLKFSYFIFGPTIFYLGMMIFYLNFTYWKEDTTFFDKISYLILNVNSIIYFVLLKKEKNGGSISFFGEDQE